MFCSKISITLNRVVAVGRISQLAVKASCWLCCSGNCVQSHQSHLFLVMWFPAMLPLWAATLLCGSGSRSWFSNLQPSLPRSHFLFCRDVLSCFLCCVADFALKAQFSDKFLFCRWAPQKWPTLYFFYSSCFTLVLRQTAQNWPFVMSLIALLFKRCMFRHIFVLFQTRGSSNNTFVSRLYIFTGGCKQRDK